MEKIEKMMKKRNDKIILNHQKKDLKALKASLKQLDKDHDEIKRDLNMINYLLDLADIHTIENTGGLSGKIFVSERAVKRLEKTKQMFEEYYLKAPEKLKSSEEGFIIAEKEKMVDEKNDLEKKLKHLDVLIAKTETFIMDIRNHLCSELTKGHDLVSVGQKLYSEFGAKVTTSFYSTGRAHIIKFLERAFLLNRIKSNLLFALLEDGKIIRYHANILAYDLPNYNYAKEGVDFFPIEVDWEINP